MVVFIALLLNCFVSYAQSSSSVRIKADKLIRKLKADHNYPSGGKDTLIDLNGDKFKDILIEYYGASGTGWKNRTSVYLYNNSKAKFIACEQLNDLANPTFYFNRKMVTGYYIGNGGGHAAKLKWNGLKLDILESIEIDIKRQGNSMVCKTIAYDHKTRKTTSAVFDKVVLPADYRYGYYQSLIRGSGLN